MLSRAKLLTRWEEATSSYWMVPSLMAGAAIALSVVTVYLDRLLPDSAFGASFYTTSPAGARSILATIAGSLISVAGVVFSITIVALTLASNQFGPRILRNFMRDKGNQVALGSLVACFLYCVLILRQVHGGEGDVSVFVPQLSVLTAVLSAMAAIGVLIYFIHHIAVSIQASNLLATIARDLLSSLSRHYPDPPPPGHQARSEPSIEKAFPDENAAWVDICADRGGYLQRIQYDDLLELATEADLLVMVKRRSGHFVVKGDAILRACPGDRITRELYERLTGVFSVDVQRSFSDDAEFALDQLVEVGVRALSPGINDPFTAIECVDWIAEILSEWARRPPPCRQRRARDGQVRVIAYTTEFTQIIDQALNQLRQNSASKLSVMIRLLETIGRVGRRVQTDADRACLAEHARMVYEQAKAAAEGARDRQKLDARHRDVMEVVGRGGCETPDES